MLIDRAEVSSGSLLNDLNPPINPSKEIVDPNDQKPANWDDREKIPDPGLTTF
jgi:calnexin